MSRLILPSGFANARRGPVVVTPPGGGGEPSGDTQVVTFTEDATTDFINPERGWMHRVEVGEYSTLRSGDTDAPMGYPINWSYMTGTPFNGTAGTNPFRLDNYATANIPQSLLDELDTVFAAARTNGIKIKVRFAYNYSSTGTDTTQAWMETHIQQLAPTINANRDVIAMMDAGFIGRWGEWNDSTDLVDSTNSWWEEPWVSARNAVYQRLLTEIHADIMIGLRYPRANIGYRSYFNGDTATHASRVDWSQHDHVANRFDGSGISRTGAYMDCLWSNESHVGTFDYDGGRQAQDIAAFAAAGGIAAVSGETCNVGGLNTYNDCSQVMGGGDADVVTLGVDFLYRKFWADMYSKWINEPSPEGGCYNDFSRRMGYRLVLNSATLPVEVAASGAMQVALNLTNRGFGKVYNRRPIDLVLVGSGGPFTVRLTADARLDLPLAGQTVDAVYNVTAPAGLVAGASYDAYLRLPDPDPLANGLASDDRYTIRLANTGLWDGATGRHNLSASVGVPA